MGMKYLYTVVPRKRLVIPGLAAPIYSRKSIKLNEKEVELCLKAGSVYRRFNADTIIKVTPSTIARYHTEKFMNDEEYEKYLKSLNDKSAHTGMVVDTDVTPKEEVTDDTTPADEESGKEESTTVDETKPEETPVQNEEAPVEDEIKESEENQEELNTSDNEVKSEEEVNEEVTDDTTPADEESGKEESTTVDETKPEETPVQNNREVINSNRSNHKHNKK